MIVIGRIVVVLQSFCLISAIDSIIISSSFSCTVIYIMFFTTRLVFAVCVIITIVISIIKVIVSNACCNQFSIYAEKHIILVKIKCAANDIANRSLTRQINFLLHPIVSSNPSKQVDSSRKRIITYTNHPMKGIRRHHRGSSDLHYSLWA